MSRVFADTGYWVALVHVADPLRERVEEVTNQLGDRRIVTSELVLMEVLNYFSRLGDVARAKAVQTVLQLLDDPDVEVVEHNPTHFKASITRYESRLDQSWSLVDCSSFLLMEELGISDALAYDLDFVQAGFHALLRPDFTSL